jgi:hypothetical protein
MVLRYSDRGKNELFGSGLKSGQPEMLAKLPGAGFFVATCFAALAIVGGAGALFVKFRDHTNQFLGPAVMLSVGIALLVITVLAENPGRAHRIVVGLRNSLIALFAVAVVLVLLLAFIGPFH